MRTINYGYTKKERNLILFSNHVKQDFPSLYEYVKMYKKAKRIPSSLNDDKNVELRLLFDRSNQRLTKIIEEMQREWTLRSTDQIPECIEDQKKKFKCELCEHTELRYLWLLTNRFNKAEMRIGSTCITRYSLGQYEPEGETWDNFIIADHYLRTKKNKREIEANVKSGNALVRIRVYNTKWENLSFLPSANITREIIDLTRKDIPPVLKRIRDHSQCLTSSDLQRITELAARFKSLIEEAKEDIARSSEWRVSRAVYLWAKEADKKDKKAETKITPLLEKSCRINSENIAYIFEEEHKKECLRRLSEMLPQKFRLVVSSEQTSRIKIVVSTTSGDYPLWVSYNALIKTAAKMGFPRKNSVQNFSLENLRYNDTVLDIQDGKAGSDLLHDIIHKAGGSVKDENESGERYLVSLGKNGMIFNVETVKGLLTAAVLSGDQTIVLMKVREMLYGGKPTPYDVVKNNWIEIYGRKK